MEKVAVEEEKGRKDSQPPDRRPADNVIDVRGDK
jgi:hypothetical protein